MSSTVAGGATSTSRWSGPRRRTSRLAGSVVAAGRPERPRERRRRRRGARSFAATPGRVWHGGPRNRPQPRAEDRTTGPEPRSRPRMAAEAAGTDPRRAVTPPGTLTTTPSWDRSAAVPPPIHIESREGHRARRHPVRHPARRQRPSPSASRSTSARACPATPSSACPTPPCRESRDRVRAAVMSTGELEWPNKRITVNLAPSGTRKSGAGLDLAIAVGVLVADEQLGPAWSTGSASSASSASTARCGGSRGWRRWSPCWRTSSPSCPWRRPPRPTSPPGAACGWRRRWPRSSPR